MYALPVLPELPPYEVVQEQRLDYLTTDIQVARSGMDCHERTALIFLRQAHIMILKATDDNDFNTAHYLEYAEIYYQSYLYYKK